MQVFVVCPSHAWGVVGAYGQRCLSENPSSRQARLLLRARWGQKLYLGDPGSRGKGFLLHMAEQRKGGRGRSSRAKDTREERMLVAVFKLGTSWCDSVHWGQKEKEVGVAEIWNARSLHKSFSWKEPIKMVFRKKKNITEDVRRSLSQRYLLGVPVGQAARYWGHAVHPRAVSWAALFPPGWASAGREVSFGWCQRDRPPLG